MTTTHTPGPWVAEQHPTKYPDLFTWSIVARKEDTGEDMTYGITSGLDCPHDAALIAAAPDLAKALKRTLTPLVMAAECYRGKSEMKRLIDIERTARAALAKAGVK